MSSFGDTRNQDLLLHPTVKPINLVADAILDCSDRGGIVLDGFAGSGTTLLAAERAGRRGYGVELDAHYCDVILRRMSAVGHSPIHVGSGRKFADLHQEASKECEEEA